MAVTGETTQLVNLFTDMQTKADKEFETKSYTEHLTCKDWDWGDNETITIPTTSHFQLTTYDPYADWKTRTGAAQQIYDEINSYTVSQKYTFHGEIDDVPSMDQRFIRKMATAVKETMDFEYAPLVDNYRFKTWAQGAGNVMWVDKTKDLIGKKGTNDEDIIRTMMKARSKMNNLRVPHDGRAVIMSESLYMETRLCDRLEYNQSYTSQAMIQGKAGEIVGMDVIVVPDDLYLPAGVSMMFKWNKATADPQKCKKIRTINNVVGSFSTHAEGLFRYDSFVKAHKADGILLVCDGTTTSANTNVCERPVIQYKANAGGTANELVISAPSSVCGVTSGVTYYYTVTQAPIFQNPKVRQAMGKATAYSSAVTGFTEGNTYYVSAYAHKDGLIDSQIAYLKFTASDTALSAALSSETFNRFRVETI